MSSGFPQGYNPVLGCIGGLTTLGSLAVGIYYGVAQSKGMPLDPTVETMLKFGPATVGGLEGLAIGQQAVQSPEIQAQVSNMPGAEGCASGCGSILGAGMGAGINGALTFVGYLIGNAIGHSLR